MQKNTDPKYLWISEEDLQQARTFDGWMDDLQFYILFNSISVISRRLADDNERLCAIESRLRL